MALNNMTNNMPKTMDEKRGNLLEGILKKIGNNKVEAFLLEEQYRMVMNMDEEEFEDYLEYLQYNNPPV